VLKGKSALITGSSGGIGFATGMQRDGISFEDAEENFLSIRQPSRRFVKNDDVAGLIAFLCGPHSADTNGASLPIDGGWLAGR
jgi:3-hydroxybutyrate dehydrogenase